MNFECNIGIVVCNIQGLNYGQTVDIIDEIRDADQIVVKPHGSNDTYSLPKRAIKRGDSIFNYAPELYKRYEN